MSKNYTFDKTMNYKFLIEDGILKNTYLVNGYDKLRSITIPNYVTELSSTAFSHCLSCYVENIYIPNSVKIVQNGAFCEFEGTFNIEPGCSAVTYENGILFSKDKKRIIKATNIVKGLPITIPEGVVEIGKKAFYKLSISNVIFPETLEFIGKEAFSFNELTDIHLPESLLKIDSEAFIFNKLTTIFLPKNIRTICSGAFLYNNLFSFIVDDNNTSFVSHEGVLFNKKKNKLIQCPPKKTGIFKIPDTTKQILKGAFSFSELDEITIPSTIGRSLSDFCSTSRIKKIVIEDGVENISHSAFLNCMFLREVVLPNSIKRIENQAFNGCPRLEKINIPKGIEYIGGLAFNSSVIEEIYIPSSVTNIGAYAFPRIHNSSVSNEEKKKIALKHLLIENNPYAVKYAVEYDYPYKEI